ncbi:MAG TPA: sensor histidine kinase [Cyclobacteriaceae bacterium]|nr:sensor histidine kinase [Cyclobacteriaceae bacterium]
MIDQAAIDSLVVLTETKKDDTLKVFWFNQIASLYHYCKSDSALYYGNQALSLAEQLQYPRGICESNESIGNYYGTFGTNDFDRALHFYNREAEIAEENHLNKKLQDAYSCILNLYFYVGDFPNAMKVSTKALTRAEAKNDSSKIAYYNNLLGFIYLRQGNPRDSRKFYQKYLNTASSIKDSIMMMDASVGLAEILLYEKKPREAIPIFRQALSFYEKCITLGVYYKRDRIPYMLFSLAKGYRDAGDNNEALKYSLRGFACSDEIQFNTYDLANYYIVIGEVYENLGQWNKALETFRLGLNLSVKIKHAENVRDAFQAMSRIYAKRKMFDSAFYYERKFEFMKDSITNVRIRREIEQINAEYNIAKKDQEIQQQEQLHQAETSTQRIITGSIIAFFLLILMIGALSYNRYRLKQRSKFQEELNRKQNELFNTVTTIQDKERKRIAQDIHDQVGSVLSAAKLQLSGLEELKSQLTEDQIRKYASAMTLMDQAAEELRNISHNLMPATLSRLGLVAALRGLFDKISEYSNLRINFNSHGFEKRIEEPAEINIYPIVLELINNVVKHAQASEATIQLIKYPTYINISVEDDGKGFDVERAKASENGIGMRNLISRIEYLNGTLNIDSAEGKGTTIMIDVPIAT